MTIYSDNLGNKFLGDCIFANHTINFPTANFLQSHPANLFSSGLTNLCNSAGLQYRNIISQSEFLTTHLKIFLAFGANTDTINDRYIFGGFINSAGGGGSTSFVGIFNDGGYAATDTTSTSLTNILGSVGNNGTGDVYNLTSSASVRQYPVTEPLIWQMPQVVGVSDGTMLSLFITQYSFQSNFSRKSFLYAGLLGDVNNTNNYYSENFVTRSVMFGYAGLEDSIPVVRGGHRISANAKNFLTTGKAQYPITCADGQTPTSQWATDMYVFDSNTTIGQPAIGKVKNLLLAQGTYTVGKPVRVQSGAMPDAGFNCWLPVGSFAGRTVLMRCYSSILIP